MGREAHVLNPKRKVVKETLLADRRRHAGISSKCEGKLHVEHKCSGGLHMNEVLYPRSVFQKLKATEQAYFWHKINCALNCAVFHERHGHSTSYRQWHFGRVCNVYGGKVVIAWIDGLPLKVKKMPWWDVKIFEKVAGNEQRRL